MATIRLTSRREIGRLIRDRMARARVGQVLVAQAKARIANRGDSQHRYPELWDHPASYRRGGEPLRDTGRLMSSLTHEDDFRSNAARFRLVSPLKHAQYHQNGFQTAGPHFIPLTRKAARNPKASGLVRGKDYLYFRRGVTVPMRKIYNMAPENIRELVRAVARAIRGQ